MSEKQVFPMPLDIQRFLMGNGPLEGVWFGDPHPTREGAFWWRNVIRERADEGFRNTRATPDVLALLREARQTVKFYRGHTSNCAVNDPGDYTGKCNCGAAEKNASVKPLVDRIDAALGTSHAK